MSKFCCFFTVTFLNVLLVYSEHNETVTKNETRKTSDTVYTDADVPDAIFRYSPMKVLHISIPARPWFDLIKIHGYLNRSKDTTSIREPGLPKLIDDKISKPNEHGEWVIDLTNYEMASGDTGFVNVIVWTADDCCYLNEGQRFVVTKLHNGTWLTNRLVTNRSQDL